MLVLALESVLSCDIARFNLLLKTINCEIYSTVLYLSILLELRASKLNVNISKDCVIIIIRAHKKHFYCRQ